MRLLVLALVLASVADAGTAGLPNTPVIAPDSLLTQWAERFDRAAAFRVIHQEIRLRPASFQSALPCHYQVRIQHADDRVEGDSALAAFLGSAIRHAASLPNPVGTCVDSIARDEIDFRLARGADMVVASYSPGKGSVTFSDARRHVRVDYLGARGAELLAILARGLPDDLRLDDIEPCTSEPRTLSDAERNRKFDESMPEAIKKVPPHYPDEARKHGVEGTVIVMAQMDTTGRVIRTMLRDQSSTFDAFAVRAVEQWRFKPAMSNGKPVSVWVSIPLKFSTN